MDDDFALLFIKKQEDLLIEYVRKSIQLEVSLDSIKSKHDELQKQHDVQLDIIKQATNSVETLTLERDRLNLCISDLEKEKQSLGESYESIISDLTNQIDQLNAKVNDSKAGTDAIIRERNNFKNEYEAQKAEMQKIYHESVKIKEELDGINIENAALKSKLKELTEPKKRNIN